MFTELLKAGKKIRVYDKTGVFTEATFYYKDDAIYYDSDAIGYNCKHDFLSEDENRFNEHIYNMLSENFNIEIGD